METVEFYRVEHVSTRRGPYTSGNYRLIGALEDRHGWASEDTHPNPRCDEGLGSIAMDEFCGFSSIAQMTEWFDGFAGALAAHGFVIRVYDLPADQVRVGARQSLARWFMTATPVVEADPRSIITEDPAITTEAESDIWR